MHPTSTPNLPAPPFGSSPTAGSIFGDLLSAWPGGRLVSAQSWIQLHWWREDKRSTGLIPEEIVDLAFARGRTYIEGLDSKHANGFAPAFYTKYRGSIFLNQRLPRLFLISTRVLSSSFLDSSFWSNMWPSNIYIPDPPCRMSSGFAEQASRKTLIRIFSEERCQFHGQLSSLFLSLAFHSQPNSYTFFLAFFIFLFFPCMFYVSMQPFDLWQNS